MQRHGKAQRNDWNCYTAHVGDGAKFMVIAGHSAGSERRHAHISQVRCEASCSLFLAMSCALAASSGLMMGRAPLKFVGVLMMFSFRVMVARVGDALDHG